MSFQVLLAVMFVVSPRVGATQVPQSIRVQVAPQAQVLQLGGFDLKVKDRLTERSLGGATRWEVRCVKDHVIFLPLAASQVGGPRPFHRPGRVTVLAPGGFLILDGRSYRDRIDVFAQGGTCQAVNEVDLEKYIAGLINREFSSKWSDEAVKAQAVAARTYALYRIREARARHRTFDLDSTVRDQVYDGAQSEDLRALRLTESTRGLALVTRGPGKRLPIKAYYHSTCGGRTELPESVWGKREPGFAKRVKCGFCNESPRYNWESDLAPQELSTLLRDALHLKPQAQLVSIAADKPRDGRVVDVVTTWKGMAIRSVKLPALKFRELLGPERIRSTTFSMESRPGGHWHVEGRGFGHGVGMCQWGAKVMGERGYSMESILAHYYPDAELTRQW